MIPGDLTAKSPNCRKPTFTPFPSDMTPGKTSRASLARVPPVPPQLFRAPGFCPRVNQALDRTPQASEETTPRRAWHGRECGRDLGESPTVDLLIRPTGTSYHIDESQEKQQHKERWVRSAGCIHARVPIWQVHVVSYKATLSMEHRLEAGRGQGRTGQGRAGREVIRIRGLGLPRPCNTTST